MIKRVVLVYFSPTHTTEKVVKAIAEGMGIKDVVEYNITISQDEDINIVDGDIVILGGPVYVGRIPTVARARMVKLLGSGQPAICVALYGNNKYGDALAELADIETKAKLIPIACASFIGEHSYANDQCHIANGRPNSEDLALAKKFGKQVISKLNKDFEESSTINPIKFPGVIPTEPAPLLPDTASIATIDCTKCNKCIEVCPVGAIDENLICDGSKCIKCFACVKSCPFDARVLTSPRITKFSKFLSELDDKTPEFFGV